MCVLYLRGIRALEGSGQEVLQVVPGQESQLRLVLQERLYIRARLRPVCPGKVGEKDAAPGFRGQMRLCPSCLAQRCVQEREVRFRSVRSTQVPGRGASVRSQAGSGEVCVLKRKAFQLIGFVFSVVVQGEQAVYAHTYYVYNMSVSVKNELSYLARLRKILEEQHGMILTSDLVRFGIPRTYLSIMERGGEIERISTGVYKKADSMEDELLSLQARYSVSVYSHETALYLHDLTDRTPLAYSVTVPSGYHTQSLNASGCKVYYVNRKWIDMGVVSLESPHGNRIRVTGLERTMVDIFRSRNRMDIQVVNDALKRYAGRKDQNLDLLYTYARKFSVQQIARQTLEVLL